MRNIQLPVLSLISLLALAMPVGAQQRGQPGMGPVAEKCAQDLGSFCPDAQHGDGSARACLEKNREKLSGECKTALDTTGRGRGGGQGRGMGN